MYWLRWTSQWSETCGYCFKEEIQNQQNKLQVSQYTFILFQVIWKTNVQTTVHLETILSLSQCGFRKGYSSQHCLLVIIEKIKEAVDNGNEFGAPLTDLLKVLIALIIHYYLQNFMGKEYHIRRLHWSFHTLRVKLNVP